MRDIHQGVSGEPRTLVVATNIMVRRLPYEPLMEALADARYIYRFEDDAGQLAYPPDDHVCRDGATCGAIAGESAAGVA